MKQNLKTFLLIIAIILGFLFYDFFSRFNNITPVLLFFMLFFTFCSINLKDIKPRKEHFFLALFQISVSIGVYYLVKQYDEVLAQGMMICILAPTAVAAVVISSMLGANVASVTSYSLLINIVISIVAPIYFSMMDVPVVLPFWTSVGTILMKIFPLLILPLLLVIVIKKLLPNFSNKLKKLSSISYYIWIISATIVMGSTMKFILSQDSNNYLVVALLIITSLFLCLFQFWFGRFIGKKFNDEQACSQYMGQKNTILAIWMAQTFLNPISSIAPAAYVLWQNLVNTFQLWSKSKK
ncbi:MAG: transporter [Bacteroidales bacterium]|jgi:BASS family bile acid:Na+ symporter|nr:transporter [Bacteroidales bacterium]